MKAVSKEDLIQGFRVQTIQEAALRVIDKKGLAAATIQDIADEAGVAKGTIYLYFKSREDLLARTADLALSQLREKLESTAVVPRPLPEQLRALLRAKVEFFDAHREFFRIHLALSQGEVERICAPRRRKPEYRLHLDRVAAFLSEAMDRGEARRMDPSRLAAFVAEGVNAIILRRLSEESPPPPESEVEWIVTTLLEGIWTGRSAS